MLDLEPLDIGEYRVAGAEYFWEETRLRRPMCNSVDKQGSAFICTRPKNHKGYHVGLAGPAKMEIWR